LNLKLNAVSAQASRLTPVGRSHEMTAEHTARVKALDERVDAEQAFMVMAQMTWFPADDGWMDHSIQLEEIEYEIIADLLRQDGDDDIQQQRSGVRQSDQSARRRSIFDGMRPYGGRKSMDEEDIHDMPTVRDIGPGPGRRGAKSDGQATRQRRRLGGQ